jgi:hypothetical protein
MQVYPLRDALHPSALFFIEKCDSLGVELNAQEVEAVNFLVTRLIQTNLWNKFRVIYPFVGRNAKTHSLNLRNIFRHKANWFGNIWHDKFGINADGINGYGNTYFAPSWLEDDNIHVAVYTGTYWSDANENCPLIGTSSNSVSVPDRGLGWMHAIYLRSPTPTIAYEQNGVTHYKLPPVFTYSCTPPDSTASFGMFAGEDASNQNHWLAHGLIAGTNGRNCYVCGKRFGVSMSQGGFRNPINPESGNDPVEGKKILYSQFPFLLFGNGRFGNSGQARGKGNLRFCSIGYYLSENENKVFYDIVNQFQTILNRNVPCNEINPVSGIYKEKTTFYPSISINSSKQRIGRLIRQIKDVTRLTPEKNLRYKTEALSASMAIKSCKRTGPRRIFLGDGAIPSVTILDLIEN